HCFHRRGACARLPGDRSQSRSRMAGNTRGSTDCAEERIKLTVEIAEKTRLALRQLDLRSVAHQFALMKIEAHAPEFIRCDLLPFSPIRPYQQNIDPHLQLTLGHKELCHFGG